MGKDATKTRVTASDMLATGTKRSFTHSHNCSNAHIYTRTNTQPYPYPHVNRHPLSHVQMYISIMYTHTQMYYRSCLYMHSQTQTHIRTNNHTHTYSHIQRYIHRKLFPIHIQKTYVRAIHPVQEIRILAFMIKSGFLLYCRTTNRNVEYP